MTASGHDPDLDLDDFRNAGHRLVDRLADLLAAIESQPVFPDVGPPGELERRFEGGLPLEPRTMAAVLDTLERDLLPFCTHVNHPGYFGLITPSPLPAGILADLLASALNQNLGVYSLGPAAVEMERQVVRWLSDLVGFGADAGGNLTSGGMAANFIALKLARDFASGDRAQHDGVTERFAAYTSEERHVSVDKAADAVGIGRDGLRIVPADHRFEIYPTALEAAIERDVANGIRPMAIIGMGGSTNTGAVDDLAALRRIADRHGAWLHIDAAYGGGVLLSEPLRGTLQGLELADSVTLDPHKWFYAPLDAGAVVVRDGARLRTSFGIRPPYLSDASSEREPFDYYMHGFEQSRRFRGLKVWMSLQRYGARRIGRWVEANVLQARRLYELAANHPDFEAAVAPRLSAVCLRYVPAGADASGADADPGRGLHTEVARAVAASGRFWIGTTVLKGRTCFRVNPVNVRTRIEHMDTLFAMLISECERVWQDIGRHGGRPLQLPAES